jgi:hypothetical protein
MGCAVRRRARRAGAWALCTLLATVPLATAGEATKAQEEAVRRVLEAYEHAIETKDLTLFRSVKPNLSSDEERRLKKAFDSTRTQVVTMTIASVDCQGKSCVVRLNRRDTIDSSIVSSFPQTMHLTQGPEGFVIEEIGR